MSTEQKKPGNGLAMKDLITIGIVSAVFFAAVMIAGAFLGLIPGLSVFAMIPAVFVTGPIFLFLSVKVPKPGAITILGIIIGILTFLLGSYWLYPVASVVLGVIADRIAGAGRYKNLKLITLSFVLYSISPIASGIMPWINRRAYTAYLVGAGADEAFMEALYASLQDWMLPVMFLGTVVMALLGALLGQQLIKKQFEKAGIV